MMTIAYILSEIYKMLPEWAKNLVDDLVADAKPAPPPEETPVSADPDAPRKCNHKGIWVNDREGTAKEFCRFCRKPKSAWET